jgi:hypothetical protein
MSRLASLRRGKQPRPPIACFYGPHGVGKSSLGSEMPSPVFICTEDGLGSIDTTSFPLARSYADVTDAIGELLTQEHEFSTLVIDSLDWLEPLVWAETCRRHNKPDIEAFGYGKGYAAATDIWRELLAGLVALRDARAMMIAMTAHAEIKRFESPETEPFDRYQPKLHRTAAAVVVEACDIVAFCNFKTLVKKEDAGFNKTIARGIGTGERLLHLVERPAYVAKNRYSLPDTLPLSWPALSHAIGESLSPTTQG